MAREIIQVLKTQVQKTQVQKPGRSSDITRFLARLPTALAARFDAEQLAAVELHFGMRHRTHHAIDIRLRLPFLRCYVVLLAGRERAAQ
jgi:hypothetical protein